MSNSIAHSGVVVRRDEEQATVKITQLSACAGCHARGACSASDSAEKLIDMPCSDPAIVVGDEVVVVASTQQGHFAVRVAFVYPFLMMLALLALLYHQTQDELLAGAVALAALIPYYGVLYLMRSKLTQKLQFTLSKGKHEVG